MRKRRGNIRIDDIGYGGYINVLHGGDVLFEHHHDHNIERMDCGSTGSSG